MSLNAFGLLTLISEEPGHVTKWTYHVDLYADKDINQIYLGDGTYARKMPEKYGGRDQINMMQLTDIISANIKKYGPANKPEINAPNEEEGKIRKALG